MIPRRAVKIKFFLSVVIPVVKSAFMPFSTTGGNPTNAGVTRLSGVSPCSVPDTATALPNQARYQLRYTRIFNFCHDTTAEGKIKDFSVCGHSCGQIRFYAAFDNREKSRKRRRHKALRRFTMPRPGYRHGTPKPPALPTALIPDIRFFCMIPCGEGKSKFFVSVGSAVVKPGFAGGSSGGGFPPQATVPRTSRLSLFGEWIGSLSSQITRAANYATFGHRYFSRPGAFFPTSVSYTHLTLPTNSLV